jgi:hypothetical protein
VYLSTANIKEDVLKKLGASELPGPEIIKHITSLNPYTENEAMFGLLELILEKKVRYRVLDGIMLYSLGCMSQEEIEKTFKDMQELLNGIIRSKRE